jgi:hypothetical protein
MMLYGKNDDAYFRLLSQGKKHEFRQIEGIVSVRVPAPAAKIPEDRKAEDDKDWIYKPMLQGAFSTRPGNEDFDKVEVQYYEDSN